MESFLKDERLLLVLNSKPLNIKVLDGGFTAATLYSLTLEDGRTYVLKTLKTKLDVARRKEQVLAQEFAAEHGLSPKVVYIDPEWRFFVMDYVKGRMLQRSDFSNAVVLNKLACNLRRLHVKAGPFYRLKTQVSRVKKHHVQSVRKGIAFPSNYATLLNEYFDESKVWANANELVWCHGDLNPGNILLTEAGEVYFIDWETASLDHPYADLGYFAFVNGLTPQQQLTFLRAYLNKHDVDEQLKTLNAAMRRVSFVTASVWFYFSESDADKTIPMGEQQKRLDSLLNSKGLKTGLQYIADEEVISPVSGDTEAIQLYALGFLKTYINWKG